MGITQKSAWFVLHRIRLAMRTGSWTRQDGEVEADETFVGGKAQNMHKAAKARRRPLPYGPVDKTVVVGTLERGIDDKPSQVNAQVISGRSDRAIQAHVRTRVAHGAKLYTDKHSAYGGLKYEFDHESVNHLDEYVRGRVHTNGIENFWALLKRGIHGTYVQIAPEHVGRYVDERVFTFNMRGLDDLGRFRTVLDRISGRRLTWASLTA